MAATNSTLTVERVHELLDYNPTTGILTWRGGGFRGHRQPGVAVGSMSSNGYLCFQIDRKKYTVHRFVWFWWYGEWPSVDIDHIDGNRTNNRIANLRTATRTVNCQNRRATSRNSTGLLGASLDRRGKYVAQIASDGRTYNLGRYETAEEAHAAYLAAKRRLHEGCTI